MNAKRKAELDKQGRIFAAWLKMISEAIRVNHAALRDTVGPLTNEEKTYLAGQMLLNLDNLSAHERAELIEALGAWRRRAHFSLLTLIEGVLADEETP